MRVLVTGATGMLGRGVARALADRGDRVTVLQRRPAGLGLPEVLTDISDADSVRGNDGNDILKGGPGADPISGAAGDDSIAGGPARCSAPARRDRLPVEVVVPDLGGLVELLALAAHDDLFQRRSDGLASAT